MPDAGCGNAGLGMGARAGQSSIAGNSDFSGRSVAISGQAGAVSPLAGVDMDRLRDAFETFRAQNPGVGWELGWSSGRAIWRWWIRRAWRFWRRWLRGSWADLKGVDLGGGGRGGFVGAGIFVVFNPGQPHGAIFYGKQFGAERSTLQSARTVAGAARLRTHCSDVYQRTLYSRAETERSGKNTTFLTLSGTRSSTPLDEYATVPTDAERRRGESSATGQAPI